MQDGERLPGGGMGGAVRIGDNVHRLAGPWTPAVHALLDHVNAAGLDGVPQTRGYDDEGREVLSYLPGESAEHHDPWPDWAYSDGLLSQVMSWLRRYHDAVRSFRPSEPLRWRAGVREIEPGEIVCHNDIGPYNVIVTGRSVRLAGVIDWDVAGPGQPLDDVAFAAWNFVPLFAPELPSRAEIIRKLSLMSASYGQFTAGVILDAVRPRLRRSVDTIASGAEAGDPGMRRLVDSGRVAAVERALARLGFAYASREIPPSPGGSA